MLVSPQRLGELGQEAGRGHGRDGRQDTGEAVAAGWLDGDGDIGPIEAAVADAGWPLSLRPSAMAQPALLSDVRFVLEEVITTPGRNASSTIRTLSAGVQVSRLSVPVGTSTR